MDRFVADLHIHSRFSRATSKQLTARHLAAWARIKGIDVLGTGDFTHPEWIDELEEALEEDASGLYRLKDGRGLEAEVDWLQGSLSGRTLFMLQAEISSIYKRGGKVRKIHNLVYMPNFDAARAFNRKLEQVGNLASDGRPILGLDSRNLMDMVLSTHPKAFVIPAHIWTPWFSVFGSKSGFDSLKECYGDYVKDIHALETGLSSDPEMNWMLSALDGYRLVSNSDAHSGEKLAREANLFSGEPSFDGIFHALRGEGLGGKFLGTVEFFPEEGKYHLDGHRKCGVVMDPMETRMRGGTCPVCGKPMTLGVLSRVMDLADRKEPEKPGGAAGFQSLIPLREIISEVVGTGPNTKKVTAMYSRVLDALGSELAVLRQAPVQDIAKISTPLGEGVDRMRAGRVIRKPGFDGQYGVISVFSAKEKREMKSGGMLAPLPGAKKNKPVTEQGTEEAEKKAAPEPPAFNPEQAAAIEAGPEPVLVLAGPGTGKTHTLMGRIASLIEKGVNPRQILAVTFTRKTAEELRKRLADLLGERQSLPRADTLHALAFEYWTQAHGQEPMLLNEESAAKVFAEANPELSGPALKRVRRELDLARETLNGEESTAQALANYEARKKSWNLADYTDLLEFWLEQIKAGTYACPYTQVLVDEIQDLSALQLELLLALGREGGQGFFAIGDPRQSIYGFRGALVDPEAAIRKKWPALKTVSLATNYRSAQGVLDAARSLFPEAPPLKGTSPAKADIRLFEAPTAEQEAVRIGEGVKALLGATSSTLVDHDEGGDLSPGDIAVLVRIRPLIPLVEQTLKRMGVPVAAPETEAFWNEPRVAAILSSAGKALGLALCDEDTGPSVPEKILTQGPHGLAAYLRDIPPFDRMFWESKAFRELAAAYEEQEGWSGLMSWINLQSELDLVGRRAEKVRILTLHASKGLEFDTVFMPALEDGLLPFAGPGVLTGKAERAGERFVVDEQEEKRLFYVGLTRAKRALFLSRAGKRRLFGRTLMLPPSRYLAMLPDELVTCLKLKARTATQATQLGLLD